MSHPLDGSKGYRGANGVIYPSKEVHDYDVDLSETIKNRVNATNAELLAQWQKAEALAVGEAILANPKGGGAKLPNPFDYSAMNAPYPIDADPIARPNHYARYLIEPITFIMANSLPFCVGNVVKYVLRYDAKNGREDLLKARRYIDMILEDMDRKAKGTAGDAEGKPL